MKTLFFLSVFVLCATIGQAQEITKLEEVKIAYTPLVGQIVQNGDEFTITLKNFASNSFIKNPIGFMKENFDIHKFIAAVEKDNGKFDYHAYVIRIMSSKGYMVANYDSEGNLRSTKQNFTNILPPYNIRVQVYGENIGWQIEKIKYMASTKGEILNKALYKMTLQLGSQKRNITIDALDKDFGKVAKN